MDGFLKNHLDNWKAQQGKRRGGGEGKDSTGWGTDEYLAWLLTAWNPQASKPTEPEGSQACEALPGAAWQESLAGAQGTGLRGTVPPLVSLKQAWISK